MAYNPSSNDPKMTPAGRVFMVLLLLGLTTGAAWWLFGRSKPSPTPTGTVSAPAQQSQLTPPVQLGIALGTEKKRWLEAVMLEWAKTPESQRINVNIIPMGSLDGAQAILKGDKRINVWAPASGLYRGVFDEEWNGKHATPAIVKEDTLALTPMVWVTWEERYLSFVKKYPDGFTFKNVGTALAEKGGWATLANKPEWGLFKVGHTHPQQSNSGLSTLVLTGYDYFNKSKGLSLSDVLTVEYANWLADFERGVDWRSSSTGNLMKEMVLKGPSSYDALFVYEAVAVDYLANAQGRWGTLRVVYPKYNIWSENPYYILDTEWTTPAQREAAGTFLAFLLSEPIQRLAVIHGFRPGNTSVPVIFDQSPFVQYQKFGLKSDLGTMCENPTPEVINNMLTAWQRSAGTR